MCNGMGCKFETNSGGCRKPFNKKLCPSDFIITCDEPDGHCKHLGDRGCFKNYFCKYQIKEKL